MLRLIRRLAWSAILVVALALAHYSLTTREESVLARLYEIVFGAPDLGPTDFASLTRRKRPNDALACRPEDCPNAEPDFVPPVYPFPEEELRRRLTMLALAEPDTSPVYRHEHPGLATKDRYVQRSRLMRYPDTIEVLFVPLTETTSTLAIYSRAQIGIRDFGVNLERIKRWTDPGRLGS
jgi:hypothetical protein